MAIRTDLISNLSEKMLSKLDGLRSLTPAQFKAVKELKEGGVGPLLDRLETLKAKRVLTPTEMKELSSLQEIAGDLKAHQGTSSFSEAKKSKSPVNLASGGFVDRVQAWADNASTAAAGASMATAATGVGAPVGVVANLASNAADLLSAGVDLVQAGAAAVQGDLPEAGKQLADAGLRAFSAIPVVGDAKQLLTVAEGATKVLHAGTAAAKASGMVDDAMALAKKAWHSARNAEIPWPSMQNMSSIRGVSEVRKGLVKGLDDLLGNQHALGTQLRQVFGDFKMQGALDKIGAPKEGVAVVLKKTDLETHKKSVDLAITELSQMKSKTPELARQTLDGLTSISSKMGDMIETWGKTTSISYSRAADMRPPILR
ncbi:MAG: hypothetical protein HY901_19130 [Deltaproteobacteria bacterium]|nr:hypothetical protein [Deltaproteobacteria bacterium]